MRFDVGLFQFLFGSILTVTRGDLWAVLALGGVSLAAIAVLGVLLLCTTIYVVLAACGSPIRACTPGGHRDALRFIDEDLST